MAKETKVQKNDFKGEDEFDYDPDGSREHVRELRTNLRSNKQEALDAKDEPDVIEKWKNIVDRSNDNFHMIKATDEALLDVGTIQVVTEGVVRKAQAMRSGTGSFDIDEFVAQLLRHMSSETVAEVDDEEEEVDVNDVPLRWDKIGRKALAKSHRVPVMDFMLGPLYIEQKKRAVGKRTRFEKNKADEKKPQELTEADITRSENETTKNVAALERLLEQQDGGVNLFKFVINPHDFGQSVENLFYLSFLIRDAKCALEISDNGEPTIYLCEQPTSEDYTGGLKKSQVVMELDMATWKRAIDVFNIKDSIIPQRPKAEMRIGNKWYG